MSLALRYIPTVQETFGLISQAQQARGLDLDSKRGFQRAKALLPILVTMIIASLRSSDQIAKALEARAFGASGVRRTHLRDLRLSTLDGILMLLMMVAFLGLIYLNLSFGLGAHLIDPFV